MYRRMILQSLRVSMLAFVFTVSANSAIAQGQHYYEKGNKVPLAVVQGKYFVLFGDDTGKDAALQILKGDQAVLRRFESIKPPKGITLTPEGKALSYNWAIIDNVSDGSVRQYQRKTQIRYTAPFFTTKSGEEVGLSHLFYVKLKAESDKNKLQMLCKEHKATIIGNNKFMPLWYTIACSKNSSGNSLDLANKFFETKEFALSQPDFMANYELQSADDEHFDEQWGFENTGQHGGTVGVDIGACAAWSRTTGDASILVAVLDHGIELDHPDMPNMSSLSYDTVTDTSPSQVRGSHGTACAGIIGAARNNGDLGVAGVAPDTTLMSISNSLFLGPNVQQELANGLNWAWQNGADVISNSWGHNSLSSPLIDDAITAALSQGRGGLGTVVVFAAGNANGAVSYPANSNPEILAIGAMSPCAERKNPSSCDNETGWGSNFGEEIDVVAPGVLIPTTDRQGAAGYDASDYTLRFNGTSSACPHVAGVAALILSVDDGLTQQEVSEIIERNAKKVGTYNYQTEPSHPNGTRHNEMGYGLIDADACVEAASSSAPTFWGNNGRWIGAWWVMDFDYIDGVPYDDPRTACGCDGEHWIHRNTCPAIRQIGWCTELAGQPRKLEVKISAGAESMGTAPSHGTLDSSKIYSFKKSEAAAFTVFDGRTAVDQ